MFVLVFATVTSSVISIWPVVSVIGPDSAGEKLIVSAPTFRFDCWTAARSEPGPLSRVFVTVNVEGTTRSSNISMRGRRRSERLLCKIETDITNSVQLLMLRRRVGYRPARRRFIKPCYLISYIDSGARFHATDTSSNL